MNHIGNLIKLASGILLSLLLVGCAGNDFGEGTGEGGGEISGPANDASLENKVKYALSHDPNVRGQELAVYVVNGDAYLIGVVDDPTIRLRLKQIAETVTGIGWVNTYFLEEEERKTIRLISDSTITAEVKRELQEDRDLDNYQIRVLTLRGEVILLGIIKTNGERDQILKHAKRVEGVEKVKSYLVVDPYLEIKDGQPLLQRTGKQ